MPDFTSYTSGIFIGLDNNDFRVAIKNSQRSGMDVKVAEASAQGFVFCRVEILISKKDD
ncbi:MAG: hypothetical protein WCA59_03655 [Candidatus Binataceae bacterium]